MRRKEEEEEKSEKKTETRIIRRKMKGWKERKNEINYFEKANLEGEKGAVRRTARIIRKH